MATFQYGNITLTHNMIRLLFCNDEFNPLVIQQLFNVTCNPTSQVDDLNANQPQHVPTTNSNKSGLDTSQGRVILIISVIIFIFGFIANGGMMFLLFTQKRFFKPSWYCVFNLVIADVLVLLNMAAFVISILLPTFPMSGRLKMFLFPSLDMFLSSASMLSVSLIAFDRMLSIGIAQWYRKRNSIIVKSGIGIVWGYCFVLFGLSMTRAFTVTSFKYNTIVFWLAIIVAFLVAIVVTAFCYIFIALVFTKHRLIGGIKSRDSLIITLIGKQEVAKRQKNTTKRITEAVWSCIAPLPFLAGWSFYLGIQTYEMINNVYLESKALNMAMMFVPWAVSAFNPVMYFLTQKSLRRELLKLCCKKRNASLTKDMHSETVTV
ncbi:sphingosine 1-phosphate receptor 1-like [Clytia hemisphaerica]|uniref:sphingosine 1-phosphate receptor 1-like n=1 Tax=Clytia hemisphaerica TaxID=252671 RepID=UPI0034D61438